MLTQGNVISVDRVTDKDGNAVWQVITDYSERDADGQCRCGIYLPRPGPVPAIGQQVAWGHSLFKGAYAVWNGERRPRLGFAFDPNSPSLYTG